MDKAEEVTPTGLIVVREHEEKPKKKPRKVPMVRGRKKLITGVEVATNMRVEKSHRLSPEDRKQRRADNKATAEIRKKTRGRKKHGRR
jgi:hypothetical protein